MRREQNKKEIEMSKYEVKGVQFHKGHEGEPLAQCGLYRDGKKVAEYSDGDWGGESQFWWKDKGTATVKGINYSGKKYEYKGTPEEALLAKHCAEIPPTPCKWEEGKLVHTTPDIFVGDLINEYETEKRLKNGAKTKTFFVLKEKGQELEYTINSPYTKETKDYLEKKYGDKLVKILNKEFVDEGDAEALAKKKAEQKIKRQCKTKTLFKLKGDEEGRYWVFPRPYSPQVRVAIEGKYGDNLVEIINERYAA